MELKAEIQQAVKSAMKSGDVLTVSTLRFLLSAIHNEEIKLHKELTTEEIQKTIATLARQRNESIVSFRKGGREELAQKEEAELVILQKYLPQPLTEEQLRGLIQQSIGEVGAKGVGDLPKVMKQVMPKVSGRSDGKRVNELAKELLSR
ncbi:MAG TPA: GatB/YqeY domain-containing protein [Candidatus Binatia bacterium]